ncbi:MAG: arginase family protein [Bacteroidia bacterium]|nr:arginase family protein [Bacteroidia bacterium]
MEWEAFLRPVGGTFPMYLQRLPVVTSFPSGKIAVEEALENGPTAVFVGYPYYQRKGRVYCWPSATRRIRKRLYRLALPSVALRLVDVGDLFVEELTAEGVYAALEEVVAELLRRGHSVVVLGGSQEAAYPLYRALAAQETPFTYALVDKRLDLLDSLSIEDAPHRRYHSDMLLDEQVRVPTWGHVIGLAWHWMSPEEENLLHEKLRILYLRLNEVLTDPDLAEPLLRMAALLSFDLSVVRGADAPAVLDGDVEGLPIEIAAKLMRFAGMGYRSDVVHIANYHPLRDEGGRTASAVALLLWYFLEGRVNLQDDFPRADRSNLERYTVPMGGEPPELVFFRHPISGRWWIEIVPLKGSGPGRLFPCTQREYAEALQGDIPRLWYVLQLSFSD